MDDNKKVFISDILRANNKLNNNLYDLIHIVPAKPLPADISKTPSCDFIPKCDKYYVPKKKIKQKVKTVRNIRVQFETDIYSDLNAELDKQRNVLLRKIRIGSAREEATKKIAKTILSNDFPVSKDIWHMVINLNPEGHTHSSQYILWNGKNIQLNGSKGGRNRFIYKYDLGESQDAKKSATKRNVISHRKQLLHNSLFVKFRPGPLSKKKLLDSSYQKFQYGNISLVSLPKPALDIQPYYGGQLGPEMTTFLNKTFMRNSNGEITEKWADFSVSVLGSNKNGCPIQTHQNNITFDLQYQCCQNRILMRNSIFHKRVNAVDLVLNEESDVSKEVKHVMSKILDYVEFNLEYDNFVKTDTNMITDNSSNIGDKMGLDNSLKDKCKKKYGELDRLDVTIIKIPGVDSDSQKTCNKLYCTLGCICESLEFPFNLKTHCGRLECMFKCVCSFSKTCDNLQYLHELIDLDSKICNSKLAKEEQKFRQTVVLSGQGNIVFNSQKRDWKTSKKYADFYSKMCLKVERKIMKELRIITPKLDCKNIEPWCMVHNLYKCFCKGKFTEKAIPEIMEFQTMDADNKEAQPINLIPDKTSISSSDSSDVKSRLRVRSKPPEEVEVMKEKVPEISYNTEKCARVKSYKGRKFLDGYYSETNRKILEMEKNDRSLLKKLLTTIYTTEDKECSQNLHTLEVGQPPSSLKELLNNVVQNQIETTSTEIIADSFQMSQNAMQRLPNKTKLVAWLEASYKQYKERADKGIVTTCLDPPKIGKVALYPWEFILSRYRERKNLFLITKQKPYRILMAVNTKNTFFESCININDIALTELERYPITVKNLLTNATDLKDNFCILCGLSQCWELIGSVTKVSEPKRNEKALTTFNCDSDSEEELNNSDKESLSSSFAEENSQENCITGNAKSLQEQQNETQNINDSDLSKWFVMTVENDFNEIHFYKKGFFVKYDSVIKAINVSRVSCKTVRLSSQKCATPQTSPQFGIYAIPNENDLNVFIGPYERHEPLGIETIKTDIPRDNKSQTRGTWIMVNKVDNERIIDQPLAFIPATYGKSDMISLENEMVSEKINPKQKEHIPTTSKPEKDLLHKNKEDKKIIKLVKPIKINKTNNIFNFIKTCSKPSVSQEPKFLESGTSPNQEKIPASSISNNTVGNSDLVKKNYKPVAEIAPQVKIVKPRNESTSTFEPSMFILKPEEINKRSLLGQITAETRESEQTVESMEMDIENFLATSSVCKISNSDVLIISDDEDDQHDTIKNVWIQPTNVENLGWISAKRNIKNDVCFEFPGFKCTDFYPEEEAFRKLNLVFSRKVYVPKNFQMQWEVVENQKDLKFKKQLQSQDLRPELVMTKRGLRHKEELMQILKYKKLSETEPKAVEFIKRRKLMMELEDATSAMLEDNTKKLLNKTISNKGVLIKTISDANKHMREEMSAKLNSLLSDSDST
ncbi:uncharacterized protein LOC123691828 isoform X2 [Colias croceus]|nr:uncharacterized protein LOC123691828 isoform X2 [Colias croceus]XP_045492360.1 uncharacterized protein LOC123691828 isoform X2 [Colias croceus]